MRSMILAGMVVMLLSGCASSRYDPAWIWSKPGGDDATRWADYQACNEGNEALHYAGLFNYGAGIAEAAVVADCMKRHGYAQQDMRQLYYSGSRR
jgi:hypothetical protein